MADNGTPTGQGPEGGDDLAAMVEQMLAQVRSNPQMRQMLETMGVNVDDPQMRAQLEAQLRAFSSGGSPFGGAMFSGMPGMGFPGFPASGPGVPTGFQAPGTDVSPTGPSSVQLATDLARKAVAAAGSDPTVGDAERRKVDDAVRVAALWLDATTTLDETVTARAMSRADWVEATMGHWDSLAAPISAGVARATSEALRKQLQGFDPGQLGPEEREMLGGMLGQLKGPSGESMSLEDALGSFDLGALLERVTPMIEQVGRHMFASQLGQAVGAFAGQVVGATEIGLPLMPEGVAGLLPANIDTLAEELEVDAEQLRLYLAVREVARVQLFSHASWLGPQIMSAVDDYARNITIDTDAIEEAVRSIDPSGLDPTSLAGSGAENLQELLSGKLFRPAQTPAQRDALARLETLLALAEGWVDVVADRACREHLPATAALGEAVRRRRIGGAAEQAFESFVGLKLTPRRLRDGANLFAALENAGGAPLRDGRWAHPDLAPDAQDLDDPMGFVEKAQGGADAGDDEQLGADLDAELRKILGDSGDS